MWDVIIVGAGPGGIFTAITLAEHQGLKVLLLEKGEEVGRRECPTRDGGGSCQRCNPCSILYGWGGAGAFSDGKLNLSAQVGGHLGSLISKRRLTRLISLVDKVFLSYGAPQEVFGTDSDEIDKLARGAEKANLKFIPTKVRHLGTERCREIITRMRVDLDERIAIRTGAEVERVVTRKGRATGVRTADGSTHRSRFVVLAPGRGGAEWLEREAKRLNLKTESNPVDLGVRVELPAVVTERLTRVTYEPKLIFYSKEFDDMVRVFCMNPYGEVVTEFTDGVVTVNGHSFARKRTRNTNFALLVRTDFTKPFKDPIAYGRYIARLANLLGGGVIVQRLGDLRAGRRSTWERIERGICEPTLKDATPGDLSFALPYRYLSNILEMIEALNQLSPGVSSPHTLLYGVEVKFYSLKLKLTQKLETEVENLFAIGDGAGITRGLVQAAVSGMMAGEEILRRGAG